MSRPLKLACLVALAVLLISGYELLVEVSEDAAIGLGVAVVAVIFGVLLVAVLHRLTMSQIRRPQNRDRPDRQIKT
jgi:hypothetical protein